MKRLFTFHSKTPDILNPGKFQRFQVDLNENSKEFKIEVRKHGENVTLMERTWEKASLPWSNLSIVAFSEYGAKPVYYKHKVKGIATMMAKLFALKKTNSTFLFQLVLLGGLGFRATVTTT